MNSKHMPMAFTEEEKGLARLYLKRFRHSPLCMKMLMCSYYADKYKSGFITPKHFLKLSMSVMDNDASLINFWNINKRPKFFGFDASIIIDGTINDVECMIIRDYEYSKNNEKL